MSYANIYFTDKIAIALVLLPLPPLLLWTALTGKLSAHNQSKSLKRILAERAAKHVMTSCSIPQLQALLGTPQSVYEAWVAKRGVLRPDIESIDGPGRLFWIRRGKRVVLYLHGGAFMAPKQGYYLDFWTYVLDQMIKKTGEDIGFAVLEYALVPTAAFPTPLNQTVHAIKHLVDSGIAPGDISLVGDSAGGNLILQVLSHALHPLPGIEPLSIGAPLRSAYLMSPWVALTKPSATLSLNDHSDWITSKSLTYWGGEVMKDVVQEHVPYAEANSAPDGWWRGAESVFGEVMVSAGTAECLLGEIVDFTERFRVDYEHVKVVIQEDGRHDDPYLDFLVGEKDLGVLTPAIVDFLA